MSRSTLREAHMKGEPQPKFAGCDEHDRCTERDKAECEWCMEEATPANPTAGIAATPAWREDLDTIEGCEEISECADGCCTFFTPRHNDECIRLAAHIERLEAERDALLAEHEAVGEGYGDETADVGCGCLSCRIIRAHDNAERVIHGER